MEADIRYIPEAHATSEEAANSWWLERFGEPMPEDAKIRLRGLLKKEVARARVDMHRLDDITLQRIHEGRRLQQTKLANVEDALQRLRQQRDRTKRYVALSSELEQLSKRLYELGKQQASVLTQQRELERFENFEAVNGRFQRINVLNQGIALARQTLGQLSLQIDEAKKRESDGLKELNEGRNRMQEAYDTLLQAAQTMTEAERLKEQQTQQENLHNDIERTLRLYSERLARLQKQQKEAKATNEQCDEELSALKLKRQSLEPHRQMIARAEGVLARLDELLETMNLRDTLSNELNQALRRQKERDEQLGRLFNEHQNLNATIKAKQEEVDGHRRNTAGQDSFALQRRAMELHARKLMLETGLSLWRSIAAGYDQIELKNQHIATLRLQADQLNRNIDNTDKEVRRLETLLQQKTYHWTLSKSQNVIELRSDLKEGQPCTVCGATHHPWQSEGITGQNALISSLKADCENMEAELRGKRQMLLGLQRDLTATTAKLEVESENLQLLEVRQKQDTDEWQTFANLDRSFVECSRSTNREARTSMMRQLIEKATVDAEIADKELDAFTFHLNAISRIGEDIKKLQQELTELDVRLNEVNTACQVMAGEVDRLNFRLAKATRNYSQRYEALEHEITIPEWYNVWQSSHEGIKMRIQKMVEQWAEVQKNIQKYEKIISAKDVEIELLEKIIAEVQNDILQLESQSAKAQDLASKAENALQRLLSSEDAKAIFQQAKERLESKNEELIKCEEIYGQQLKAYMYLSAQQKVLDGMVLRDEKRIADDRNELDLWMQKYNSNNPPVQFSELERVLADGTDWTNIRKNVREISLQTAITQARVDHLKAQIIALQAEGVHPNISDIDQEMQNMQQQQEELEARRREILRQMSHLDEQIRAHEQTLTATGTTEI